MRTIPTLLQAAAALLAYPRVVIAAPAATRSVVAYPPFVCFTSGYSIGYNAKLLTPDPPGRCGMWNQLKGRREKMPA